MALAPTLIRLDAEVGAELALAGSPTSASGVLLETTVPAVNSALQRAWATLAAAPVAVADRPLSDAERRALARFVDAWHRRDVDALADLLAEDVVLSMPPQRLRFAGRAEVMTFLSTVPAEGRLDLIRLASTRANGQPAVAAYLPDDTGACRGYGMMVLTVAGGRVTRITGFPDPGLFPVFDLATRHRPPHR